MGFLNNLLRGPAAIAMKGAEPETGALPRWATRCPRPSAGPPKRTSPAT